MEAVVLVAVVAIIVANVIARRRNAPARARHLSRNDDSFMMFDSSTSTSHDHHHHHHHGHGHGFDVGGHHGGGGDFGGHHH